MSKGMIELNARPLERDVRLAAPDLDQVTARVSDRLGALLGRPPGSVLTGSCSHALEAAASLLGLAPGDEVVVPAFAFPTAVSPFAARGAVVRFADVEERTMNVDPASVLDRLSPATRAVVVLHYAGVAADLDSLVPELEARGIDLIEDAAHGLFGTVDGGPLGRVGRFSTFSFHRTKNVSALEGGLLVANRPSDLADAHIVVDKGTDRWAFERGEVLAYEWKGLGSSWRMGEGSLRYLDQELARAEWIQFRREAVLARYRSELEPLAVAAGVGVPEVPDGRSSPAHLYHLVLPTGWDREDLVARCAARGVQVARHYGSLPASTAGRRLAMDRDRCPVAASVAPRLVRVPLHHDLEPEDVDRVIQVVAEELGRVGAAVSW